MQTVRAVTEGSPPEPRPGDGGIEPGPRIRPGGRRPAWSRAAVLLPVVLFVAAAGTRFWDIGHPGRQIFDERHYVEDAYDVWQRGVEDDRPAHPPLGKVLLAAGMEAGGLQPSGWRLAPAVAGVVTVMGTYAAGLVLLRRPSAAFAAGLLVALDGLALTMSRIAMLDVFVAAFVSAAFWLVVLDRQRRDAGGGGSAGVGRLRLLAGVLLGAAVATKWSGALALLSVLVLVVWWDAARARRSGRSIPGAIRSALPGAALALVVVPAAVYVASYTSWFVNYTDTETGRERCAEEPCDAGPGERLAGWWFEQWDMFHLQRRLEATHPHRSHAVLWPLGFEPVPHYIARCPAPSGGAAPAGEAAAGVAEDPPGCSVPPGHEARIVGRPNYVLWWAALAAWPIVGWWALRRRDWRAAALGVMFLGQWAPWLLSWKPGFLFYMTPVVATMALAVAYGALAVPRRGGLLLAAVVTAAVAGAVVWWPEWMGWTVTGA